MAGGGDPLADDAELRLDRLQRDILIPQIEAFLEATSDSEAQGVYRSLKAAVERGAIPDELQARLGAIVDLALSSGRVRKLFGPAAELSLFQLFRKTPVGKAIQASIDTLNTALSKLSGQSIQTLSVSLTRPGGYTLTVTTNECRMVIQFDPAGVNVESLDLNLA